MPTFSLSRSATLFSVLFSSLLTLGFSTGLNAASIKLDNVIVNFEDGKERKKDIDVTNTSQEIAYVSVEVYEVQNPGTDKEVQKKILNPKDITLLVTPNKMIIPPKGHKLIRLVNIAQPSEEERIFRLKVSPVEGPSKSKETGVKVLVAYGVLVMVEPVKPEAKLTYSKKGLKVQMANTGNVNTLIDKGKVCPYLNNKNKKGKERAVSEDGCEVLTARRLYAGNQWEFELPFDGEVSFQKSTRNDREDFIIQ